MNADQQADKEELGREPGDKSSRYEDQCRPRSHRTKAAGETITT